MFAFLILIRDDDNWIDLGCVMITEQQEKNANAIKKKKMNNQQQYSNIKIA